MAIIISRITNNLNYTFTMPGPNFNNNQNANLIIPANAVDLDLLTLTTEDGLWAIQQQFVALASNGSITVTGTIDTATFEYDGVGSIHADANPDIRGNIHLVSGTNVTLSQLGQNITINATGGGGGVTYPLLAPETSGNLAAPSYSFAVDPECGMSLDNVNHFLYFNSPDGGGDQVMYLDGSGILNLVNGLSVASVTITNNQQLNGLVSMAMGDDDFAMTAHAGRQILLQAGDDNTKGITIFSDGSMELDAPVGGSILMKAGALAGIEIDDNVVGLGRPMFFDTVTTAQRNAFGNHSSWMIYNTDTNQPEFNNGTSWVAMSGGGGGSPGGSDTQIQFNNAGSFGATAALTYGVAGGQLNIVDTGASATLWLHSDTPGNGGINFSNVAESVNYGSIGFTTSGLSITSPSVSWLFSDPGTLLAPNGSAGIPAYSFASTPTAGMWLSAPDTIKISTNAGEILVVNGTTSQFNGDLYIAANGVAENMFTVNNGDLHVENGSVITQTVTTSAGGIMLQSTSAGDAVTLDAATGGSVAIQADAGNKVWIHGADGTLTTPGNTSLLNNNKIIFGDANGYNISYNTDRGGFSFHRNNDAALQVFLGAPGLIEIDANTGLDGTGTYLPNLVMGNGVGLAIDSTSPNGVQIAEDSTGATPAGVLLELKSTTRGFLPPKMTTAQRNVIATPATGLEIYNTDTNALEVWTGLAWQSFGRNIRLNSAPSDGNNIMFNLADGTPLDIIYGDSTGVGIDVNGGSTEWLFQTNGTLLLPANGNIQGSAAVFDGGAGGEFDGIVLKLYKDDGGTSHCAEIYAESTGDIDFDTSTGGGAIRLMSAQGILVDQTLAFTNPAASAALEVRSTTKGFLPPRMTTTERDAIASPAAGLMLYNTTVNKLQVWDGSVWQNAW